MPVTQPLRKIVEHFEDEHGRWDRLECGHVLACGTPGHDPAGPQRGDMTLRPMRSCRKCAEDPDDGS